MKLLEKFTKEISIKLKEELGIKNVNSVPSLSRIVINMGIKDVLADSKRLEKETVVLEKIAGQKPKVTKAKKSIATFKLREGDKIGLMVTLRGKRMYDFFEKLTSIVLPRLRDFHGVKTTSFDGRGNYTLGFAESSVFPEVDQATLDRIQGLEVVIVTTAGNNEKGFALLKALGMPFQK